VTQEHRTIDSALVHRVRGSPWRGVAAPPDVWRPEQHAGSKSFLT